MSSISQLRTYIKDIVRPARTVIGHNKFCAEINEGLYIPESDNSLEILYGQLYNPRTKNPFKRLKQKVVKQLHRFVDKLNPNINLINLKKHKFEIFERLNILPKKLSETILNAILQCKDLTYDTPNLKLMKDFYGNKNVFDLGLRFAIVANNTFQNKGQAYIIKKMPEMFYGIEHKELCESLDILNLFLKPDKINKFTIGGKDFTAKFIGQGCNNDIYLIENSAGKKVCLRLARDPYSIMGFGHDIFTEVAINIEAQKAGVENIAKLYMTNPIGTLISSKSGKLGYKVKGAWQIVEYVDKSRINPPDKLTLQKWLDSKGLEHSDLYIKELKGDESNIISSTIVDLGGIQNPDKNMTLKHRAATWLPIAYQHGFTSKDIFHHFCE